MREKTIIRRRLPKTKYHTEQGKGMREKEQHHNNNKRREEHERTGITTCA